jgi:hypothetical protein
LTRHPQTSSKQANLDTQPFTMATIFLIKEAVMALKERTGSSVMAINKWIESEKKVSLMVVAGESIVVSLDCEFC